MESENLLISDLDGTLLGDDGALNSFAEWYEREGANCRLVYSSGRFVESVSDSIVSTSLPVPQAIIGGVGTQIYEVDTVRKLPEWPPVSDGWNPATIQEVCAGCAALVPQPDELQSYYKISYYGLDLAPDFIDVLQRRLRQAQQDVAIVYSSNRDLDILPATAGKGAAAAFLASRWNVDPTRTIVAGDSGNDADMFRMGFNGIVVANAHPELKSLQAANIYQAAGAYAAGVVEGLRFWFHHLNNTNKKPASA